MNLNIIGITLYGREPACSLIQNGAVRAVYEEAELRGTFDHGGIPGKAFRACLDHAGLSITDIDRLVWVDGTGQVHSEKRLQQQAEMDIGKWLGYTGPVHHCSAPLASAMSVYVHSGYEEANLLYTHWPGLAGSENGSVYLGEGTRAQEIHMHQSDELYFLDRLSLFLYTFLGIDTERASSELDGLARLGKPVYLEQCRQLLDNFANGHYEMQLEYLNPLQVQSWFVTLCMELFGCSHWHINGEITLEHCNIACSLWQVIEERVLSIVELSFYRRPAETLCWSGSGANQPALMEYIRRNGPYRKVLTENYSHSSSIAIGAAMTISTEYTQASRGSFNDSKIRETEASFGSRKDRQIEKLLQATGLKYTYCLQTSDLIEQLAALLHQGKLVGWSASCARKRVHEADKFVLLGDPGRVGLRNRVHKLLNSEGVPIPLRAIVLEGDSELVFDLREFPLSMKSRVSLRRGFDLPGIMYADQLADACDIQETDDSGYAELLSRFKHWSGYSVLMQVPMQRKGEPQVVNEADALALFFTSELDVLVCGRYIVERACNDNEMDFYQSSIQALRPVVQRTERRFSPEVLQILNNGESLYV